MYLKVHGLIWHCYYSNKYSNKSLNLIIHRFGNVVWICIRRSLSIYGRSIIFPRTAYLVVFYSRNLTRSVQLVICFIFFFFGEKINCNEFIYLYIFLLYVFFKSKIYHKSAFQLITGYPPPPQFST